MKRLKKHLALLAAAALALTLLAGCTVRPGPDGNIIIVPEEDDYIPAPPVAEAIPENVGEILESSITELKSYDETTYKGVYAKMKAASMGKTYCLIMEQIDGSQLSATMTWAKYETNYYLADGDQQLLIVEGEVYQKVSEEGLWQETDDMIPPEMANNMFELVMPNFENMPQNTKWYKAETTGGFNVDYCIQPLENIGSGSIAVSSKTSIYCWNGQLAKIKMEEMDASGKVTQFTEITYRTQTTLPDSIENLLKDPPIPPETPAPVN